MQTLKGWLHSRLDDPGGYARIPPGLPTETYGTVLEALQEIGQRAERGQNIPVCSSFTVEVSRDGELEVDRRR